MQLLHIRYYQLKRDLGILFFAIIAIIFGLSYFFFNHQKHYEWYVVGLIIFIVYNFNQNRNDLIFIKKQFNLPLLNIISEYQLAILPISFASLCAHKWFCFLILHVACLFIAIMRIKRHKIIKYNFFTHFFTDDYIFISGIRASFFILLLFLSIAVVLSPVKLFPLIALFILNQTIFNFYNFNEGIQLLRAKHITVFSFLNSILKKHIKYLIFINLPVLVINSIFNYDMLYFNLFFLVYSIISHACVVYLKYENYNPKTQQQNNQLKLIIISIGLFLPYLTILTILFFFQSKKNANQNLSHYLNDTIS